MTRHKVYLVELGLEIAATTLAEAAAIGRIVASKARTLDQDVLFALVTDVRHEDDNPEEVDG